MAECHKNKNLNGNIIFAFDKRQMNTKLIVGATAGYLAAVNVGAAALFYYDKQQALNHGWRVSGSASHPDRAALLFA